MKRTFGGEEIGESSKSFKSSDTAAGTPGICLFSSWWIKPCWRGTSGSSMEDRIRKMEESQKEILQLLRGARQPMLAEQEEVRLPQAPSLARVELNVSEIQTQRHQIQLNPSSNGSKLKTQSTFGRGLLVEKRLERVLRVSRAPTPPPVNSRALPPTTAGLPPSHQPTPELCQITT
ncbi:hypothetical protein M5K25_009778 [Dendrobium thyrsiflorum]|uniref:Uncharacterized protein n=1 Tax=Dendrobium thyrsiflorum TaxID=117978 RepID=A0ABD0V744_DENTH